MPIKNNNCLFNTNHNNNNNNKEGSTMTNNNTNNITSNPNLANPMQFAYNAIQNGCNVCIPVIDGTERPEFAFAYVSETDKANGLAFIEKAAQTQGGDPRKMAIAITQFFTMATEGYGDVADEADEIIEQDGKQYILSYKEQKLYNEYGQEIANLDEFKDDKLTKSLIRKMLLKTIQ